MKIFVASDIHGSAYYCKKMISCIEKEKPDKIIFLGDILYHGPRNDLPYEYNPKEVIKLLNSLDYSIVSVRGNCDSEVDLMVSKFPIINELSLISLDNLDIYLTHGHIYNENNWNKENSILIYGHLHIPFIKEKNNSLFINPGSISLPKENNKPSYLIYDNKKFTIFDINDNIIAEKSLN